MVLEIQLRSRIRSLQSCSYTSKEIKYTQRYVVNLILSELNYPVQSNPTGITTRSLDKIGR